MCPFFCDSSELNGKKLQNISKRELMNPFNMNFYVKTMLGLQLEDDNLNFKTFKETKIA